jgi:hypothetical protein
MSMSCLVLFCIVPASTSIPVLSLRCFPLLTSSLSVPRFFGRSRSWCVLLSSLV